MARRKITIKRTARITVRQTRRFSVQSRVTPDQAIRQAQVEAQQAQQLEQQRLEAMNRNTQRKIDQINRELRRVAASEDADARQRHRSLIRDLNRQLRDAGSETSYSGMERELADRVREAAPNLDEREFDVFLSYARLDGAETAEALCGHLEGLGVRVWFDALAIRPGKSQALQMDEGLRKARAGIALLTPTYLTGRFWTERELGVLLGKDTLIPVLHQVSFDNVKEYSSFLPDLAGFETKRDDLGVIASKIAAAVLEDSDAASR